jgi:transglutaminase-like putative cysteine protease
MPSESRASSLEQFFQFALLGMIASGYGAVVSSGTLDSPTVLFTGAAILARVAIAAGLLHVSLSERAATLLAIAYIAFYPFDYFFLSAEFLTSTVHLVFFISAVLLLKASTPRDYRLLELISFLQMLAGSVLSINALYLVFLALFLLAATAALASGEVRGKLESGTRVTVGTLRGARRGLGFLSAFTFVAILALGGMFFVLLPRTANAALQHLIPNRYHLPGFSNEVTLGQIGEIRMSSTPVMHVRVYNSVAGVDMKWRGTTLSQFDGRRWFNELDRGEPILVENRQAILTTPEQWARPGRRVQFEVQLKSATDDVLFFLGLPEAISIDAPQIIRTSAGGFRTGGLAYSMRYEARSFLDDPHTPPLQPPVMGDDARKLHLQLPLMDPAIGRLAREVTHNEPSPEAKARAIEKHLRTQYGYTTQLLSAEVKDPVSHFLFQRKEGHCEYFASSMALMLRTIGIPSRVATGFQSGTYNPISNWYLIRASDAHSWVEAWIDGRGWVTFDPTPSGPAAEPTGLWQSAGMYLDALEVFWQDWVMSYDLERQLLLAEGMGQKLRLPSWSGQRPGQYARQLWSALAGAFDRRLAETLGACLLLVWLVWKFAPKFWALWLRRRDDHRLREGTAAASDATLLYQRLLDALRAHGNEKPAWLTPREFARTLERSPHAELVREATGIYEELRYGARQQPAHRLLDLVTALERSRRA